MCSKFIIYQDFYLCNAFGPNNLRHRNLVMLRGPVTKSISNLYPNFVNRAFEAIEAKDVRY